MLYVISLIALFASMAMAHVDPDHEINNVGNCREKCSDICMGARVKPERLCSAFDVNEIRHVVDPWMCGEPRCQQVECGDCGDQALCEQNCEEFKAANELGATDFPRSCKKACMAVPGDYKCFQRCTRFPEIFDKPPCDEYMCSEALCTAPGRQNCNAVDKLVDPMGKARNADKCPVVQCSFCGNHQDCITHCERYNKNEGGAIDCAGECQSVEGYKCFYI